MNFVVRYFLAAAGSRARRRKKSAQPEHGVVAATQIDTQTNSTCAVLTLMRFSAAPAIPPRNFCCAMLLHQRAVIFFLTLLSGTDFLTATALLLTKNAGSGESELGQLLGGESGSTRDDDEEPRERHWRSRQPGREVPGGGLPFSVPSGSKKRHPRRGRKASRLQLHMATEDGAGAGDSLLLVHGAAQPQADSWTAVKGSLLQKARAEGRANMEEQKEQEQEREMNSKQDSQQEAKQEESKQERQATTSRQGSQQGAVGLVACCGDYEPDDGARRRVKSVEVTTSTTTSSTTSTTRFPPLPDGVDDPCHGSLEVPVLLSGNTKGDSSSKWGAKVREHNGGNEKHKLCIGGQSADAVEARFEIPERAGAKVHQITLVHQSGKISCSGKKQLDPIKCPLDMWGSRARLVSPWVVKGWEGDEEDVVLPVRASFQEIQNDFKNFHTNGVEEHYKYEPVATREDLPGRLSGHKIWAVGGAGEKVLTFRDEEEAIEPGKYRVVIGENYFAGLGNKDADNVGVSCSYVIACAARNEEDDEENDKLNNWR